MIFHRWVDARKSRMRVYEAIEPAVRESEFSVRELMASGYLPMRDARRP
jgi:hypothetical protein